MRDFIIRVLGGYTPAEVDAIIVQTAQQFVPTREPFVMKEFVGFNEINNQIKASKSE